MTKKIVSRALTLAGLFIASFTLTFAQGAIASQIRYIPALPYEQQIVPSTVIVGSSIALTADQRKAIDKMNVEVAALNAERAKLITELRAVTTHPKLTDHMAATEGTPREARVREINKLLAPIITRQQTALAALLTAEQQAQVAQLVADAKVQSQL